MNGLGTGDRENLFGFVTKKELEGLKMLLGRNYISV